jgi:uncharacterized protein YdcH (DUF465 family)
MSSTQKIRKAKSSSRKDSHFAAIHAWKECKIGTAGHFPIRPFAKSRFAVGMPIEHQSLAIEFPAQKETISTLKQENAHFSRLMGEYETIDKEIVRMEEGIETPSDDFLTEEKKKRLELKDQLYAMIKQAESA